jgi:hypothetical protein
MCAINAINDISVTKYMIGTFGTYGRKGAKEKSGFPFVMLSRLICVIREGIWNQTLGMIREIKPISRAKMGYRVMFLDLILASNGMKKRKKASHCLLEKPC